MKKFIHYNILFITCLLALNACYKDKGNYTYTDLDAFFVDSTKVGSAFVVQQFDTFRLKSALVYNGDRSRLKFSWSTYLITYPPFNGNYADTLSTAENLGVPISILPNKYWLEFTATDTVTGRRAAARYTITVESTGSGLLVMYAKNNQVDCDLIKTKLLEGLLPQEKVLRNLYTQANPKRPLTDDPVAIAMFKYGTQQYINMLTTREAIGVSPADFAITREFNKQFLIAPNTKKPQGYFAPPFYYAFDNEQSAGWECMVNDGSLYVNLAAFGLGKETFYNVFTSTTGNYYANPNIIQGAGRFVVFDQLNRKFLAGSTLGTTLNDYPSSPLGSPPFNFNNIGKDLVYLNYGYGAQYMVYGIFKNPTDNGQRFLYVMDFGGSIARALIDISAYPGIAQTNLFAFGQRGQLLFYGVGNKLYRIPFDFSTNTAQTPVDAWPNIPADEEITCMKMSPHPGRNLPENALDKYLMVATYNKTTGMGKVYMLQLNVTSGAVQSQPAAVYDGFGKIKDIAFKF